MKFLVVFATLCLLQAIAGQEIKEGHKLNAHNHGLIGVQVDKQDDASGHKGEEQIAQQISRNQDAGEITVEIPSKVQQIVTQVSQHIPIVVGQHIANLKRMQRSPKNLSDWQLQQLKAGERPHSCDFICNQVDVAICGYNGRCYQEFESQCELNTYNCMNSQKIFEIVDKFNCQDISFPKCYRGDM
ncbi:uncharacterized protein LOC135954613 [Calliphora vicina]|uniref:uncharacterized protein LOC135954613 n=1 Tax=Calliphora vicina TaxID=7373 RepID=UPI00325C1F95